jgi:predicted transcriptional regulator
MLRYLIKSVYISPDRQGARMDNDKKMDAIDLIISILKEHEETLNKLATKIENLVALKQAELNGKTDWR